HVGVHLIAEPGAPNGHAVNEAGPDAAEIIGQNLRSRGLHVQTIGGGIWILDPFRFELRVTICTGRTVVEQEREVEAYERRQSRVAQLLPITHGGAGGGDMSDDRIVVPMVGRSFPAKERARGWLGIGRKPVD